MKAILIILVHLMLVFSLFSQDTLVYEIKAAQVKLGEVLATRTIFKNNDSIRYRFESKLKVFKFYNIHYLMESVYSDSLLKRTLSRIDVNEKNHHFCATTKTKQGYVVKNYSGRTFIHTNLIYTSVTPHYFKVYNGPDTIFSEFSGMYRIFKKTSDSTYVLNPDDPMEFYFNKEQIVKVTIPNSILDFYIELKE